MKHRFRVLPFLLFILILGGCEYFLKDENFRDVTPPDGSHNFDVILHPEKDTIMVFDSTDFKFSIETYGLKIWESEFNLGTKKWTFYADSGTFTIAPQMFAPGYDSLGMVAYSNSGSGSIADSVGVEGYMIIKHWFLLVDGRPGPAVTPEASITNDGHLMITWPGCDQYNFYSYEYTGVQVSKTILDAGANSYTDTSYVGGPADFRVNIKVITQNQVTTGNILTINDSIPRMNFEEKGTDSLRIFWNRSKYKCRYRLQEFLSSQFVTIMESAADTTFTILRPGTGLTGEFMLYTMPFHTDATNSHYIQFDHDYYYPGKGINEHESAMTRIVK